MVLEPRHSTWAEPAALDVLEEFSVAKVRADPERVSVDPQVRDRVEPVLYYRLHGAPSIYRSPYSTKRLTGLSNRIRSGDKEAWVIFDNTTLGFATGNALELRSALSR